MSEDPDFKMQSYEHLIDVPYRCPRCGDAKVFITLSDLKYHLAQDHSYNPARKRLQVFSYDVKNNFSGHSSPLLQSFIDDGRQLEQQLKQAKDLEMKNKLNRYKHPLKYDPVSSLTPSIYKPSPAIKINDNYLQDSLSVLNNEVSFARHNQWRTADVLYKTQDVLSGLEEAAEVCCHEQKTVISHLNSELREKENQLKKSQAELDRLRQEQTQLIESTDILSQKTNEESKKLSDELRAKEASLEKINAQLAKFSQKVEKKEIQKPIFEEKVLDSDYSNKGNFEKPTFEESSDETLGNNDYAEDDSISRRSIHEERDLELFTAKLKQMQSEALRKMRSKDKQLLKARKRSEKLEEDRLVLLHEMQDLLSKANVDNDKLKTELRAKEKRLLKFNADLEMAKKDQKELLGETVSLYNQADGNIKKLKEMITIKDFQLRAANEKLAQFQNSNERLLAESESIAQNADEKGTIMKKVLKKKEDQLMSVKKELESVKGEKEKLSEDAVNLRKRIELKEREENRWKEETNKQKEEREKMENKLKDLIVKEAESREAAEKKLKDEMRQKIGEREKEEARLKDEVKNKETELEQAKVDLLSLQRFLQVTAAKEKVARQELEKFISEIIDRAEKAEKELRVLKRKVNANVGDPSSEESQIASKSSKIPVSVHSALTESAIAPSISKIPITDHSTLTESVIAPAVSSSILNLSAVPGLTNSSQSVVPSSSYDNVQENIPNHGFKFRDGTVLEMNAQDPVQADAGKCLRSPEACQNCSGKEKVDIANTHVGCNSQLQQGANHVGVDLLKQSNIRVFDHGANCPSCSERIESGGPVAAAQVQTRVQPKLVYSSANSGTSCQNCANNTFGPEIFTHSNQDFKERAILPVSDVHNICHNCGIKNNLESVKSENSSQPNYQTHSPSGKEFGFMNMSHAGHLQKDPGLLDFQHDPNSNHGVDSGTQYVQKSGVRCSIPVGHSNVDPSASPAGGQHVNSLSPKSNHYPPQTVDRGRENQIPDHNRNCISHNPELYSRNISSFSSANNFTSENSQPWQIEISTLTPQASSTPRGPVAVSQDQPYVHPDTRPLRLSNSRPVSQGSSLYERPHFQYSQSQPQIYEKDQSQRMLHHRNHIQAGLYQPHLYSSVTPKQMPMYHLSQSRPQFRDVKSVHPRYFHSDILSKPLSHQLRCTSSRLEETDPQYPMYGVQAQQKRVLDHSGHYYQNMDHSSATFDVGDGNSSQLQKIVHPSLQVDSRQREITPDGRPIRRSYLFDEDNVYPEFQTSRGVTCNSPRPLLKKFIETGDSDSQTESLELSIDENGIMWDEAGDTTCISEDFDAYRLSPSGSETAGDVDSSLLLSGSMSHGITGPKLGEDVSATKANAKLMEVGESDEDLFLELPKPRKSKENERELSVREKLMKFLDKDEIKGKGRPIDVTAHRLADGERIKRRGYMETQADGNSRHSTEGETKNLKLSVKPTSDKSRVTMREKTNSRPSTHTNNNFGNPDIRKHFGESSLSKNRNNSGKKSLHCEDESSEELSSSSYSPIRAAPSCRDSRFRRSDSVDSDSPGPKPDADKKLVTSTTAACKEEYSGRKAVEEPKLERSVVSKPKVAPSVLENSFKELPVAPQSVIPSKSIESGERKGIKPQKLNDSSLEENAVAEPMIAPDRHLNSSVQSDIAARMKNLKDPLQLENTDIALGKKGHNMERNRFDESKIVTKPYKENEKSSGKLPIEVVLLDNYRGINVPKLDSETSASGSNLTVRRNSDTVLCKQKGVTFAVEPEKHVSLNSKENIPGYKTGQNKDGKLLVHQNSVPARSFKSPMVIALVEEAERSRAKRGKKENEFGIKDLNLNESAEQKDKNSHKPNEITKSRKSLDEIKLSLLQSIGSLDCKDKGNNSVVCNPASVKTPEDLDKFKYAPRKPAKPLRAKFADEEVSSEADSRDDVADCSFREESTDFDFESDLEKFSIPHRSSKSGVLGSRGGSRKTKPISQKKIQARRAQAANRLSAPKMPGDESSEAASDSSRLSGRRHEAGRKRRVALFCVFNYLDTRTLSQMAQVCREWRHVSRHPSLWKKVHLKSERISSAYLAAISQWCTELQSLTLEGLRGRRRQQDENIEEYQRNTRASLESGLECLLKACQDTLKSLHIVDCGNILTEKSLWLASCYGRMIQNLHYVSNTDPVAPEVLWALGGGCPGITTLVIPPLFPCQKPKSFNNRCLLLIAKFYADLLELGIGGKEISVLSGLLPLVQACQRLQYLELDHMEEVTEDSATALCRAGLRHLKVLELNGTPIAPKAVQQFYKSCRHLKSIRILLSFSDYHDDSKNKKHRDEYRKQIQKLQDLCKQAGLGNILKIQAAPVE